MQPQWVFDCINENMILPVNDYLPGATLPAHLSPFIEVKEGDYIPPEKQRLINLKLGIIEEQQVEEVIETEELVKKSEPVKEEKKNGTKQKVEIKNGSDISDQDEEDDEEDEDDEEEEEYKSTESEEEEEEEEVEEEKPKNTQVQEPKVN